MDSELLAEREHLDHSRAALRRMRERTSTLADNAGDELTSWALGRLRAQRLADLADRPEVALFFGRLCWPHEDFHIGRRHIVDASGVPLVLDWRAPLSRTFYQASASDPMGVELRRRFGFDGGELTGFEDEKLSSGSEQGEDSAILAAEIERPRVGPMRDIVATIQPEQDELVRADLTATLCVQGAPGTGKTAVGLHRAAFLLYAFRQRLEQSGVLIVGPNTGFMSYIQNVLPTLGEVDVTQLAVDELCDGVAVRSQDSMAVAQLKHDARMAEVLRRAVWNHVSLPQDSLMIPEGGWRWRLGTDYLRDAVAAARDDDVPYLVGRERVRAQLVNGLRRQVELRSGESPTEAWGRKMGRTKVITNFLDESWPILSPKKILSKLYTDAEFCSVVCEGLLDPDEQQLLSQTVKNPRWTNADTVLIDEIACLLERPGGYGHIVVDEAQDLSPMQCRVIARRSSHGSLTILGDLAQGTTPWTSQDWRETLRHMGKQDGHVVELSVGFRVPADIISLANRLLPKLDVNVPAARSLRRDGHVTTLHTNQLHAGIAQAIAEAKLSPGSIGVIGADATIAKLSAGDEQVELVPASLTKGLEFDHVILAEPHDIVAAEPMGLRRLYVALTRAVSGLTIVHSQPLPAELG